MHLLPLFTAARMCMHNITYCHFLLLQQQRWRLLREVWKLSIQVSLCLRFLPREWKPRLSFNRTENEDHPISKWILDVCSVVCNCFLSNIFTRGTAKRVSGRKKMGSEELSENIWGLWVKALCPLYLEQEAPSSVGWSWQCHWQTNLNLYLYPLEQL